MKLNNIILTDPRLTFLQKLNVYDFRHNSSRYSNVLYDAVLQALQDANFIDEINPIVWSLIFKLESKIDELNEDGWLSPISDDLDQEIEYPFSDAFVSDFRYHDSSVDEQQNRFVILHKYSGHRIDALENRYGFESLLEAEEWHRLHGHPVIIIEKFMPIPFAERNYELNGELNSNSCLIAA